jgi:hypothetical protein
MQESVIEAAVRDNVGSTVVRQMQARSGGASTIFKRAHGAVQRRRARRRHKMRPQSRELGENTAFLRGWHRVCIVAR